MLSHIIITGVLAVVSLFVSVSYVHRAIKLALKSSRTELEAKQSAMAGAFATFMFAASLLNFIALFLLTIVPKP